MQTTITYKNPPIKEAIITFTVNKEMGLSVINDFALNEKIRKNYPNKKDIFHYNISLIADAQKPDIKELVDGYSLECNKGGNKIIKITSNQIALHNFTTYIGWTDFVKEAIGISEIIQTLDSSLNVQTLNIRYVNQISIPLPLEIGLEEYLVILPTLPANSKPLDNFFIQLQNANNDNSIQSILNQTIVHNTNENITVLLDIAVTQNNTTDLKESFQHLHDFKNELFESALTEKTKQLFN